jgi:hypothetical protein
LIISTLKIKAEQSETTYKSGNLAVNYHQIADYQYSYKIAGFCCGGGTKTGNFIVAQLQ